MNGDKIILSCHYLKKILQAGVGGNGNALGIHGYPPRTELVQARGTFGCFRRAGGVLQKGVEIARRQDTGTEVTFSTFSIIFISTSDSA